MTYESLGIPGAYAITLIMQNKTKGMRDSGRVLLERKK
ncbi:hypothetical protein APHMUC_0600 [Anaplasma phagocytophilum str. ApMUC09]|uniref:Uncharacterized protein n=1 Tax=Anaplasma phagocytophilum str. ApMUC09 TaxID=1359152 RepID=A0A0F3NBL4_ANAPH|nr:hypothetical protein APHMUC_0600 [Anaplasma phagocytophilum str. ApMUC09]